MSQAGIISSSSSPPPPVVATSYVTDVNSPAIPLANILNVLGNDVITNNVNGIYTDGSSGSNTLTIELTNRLSGTGTTVGATTADLVTFTLSGANLGAVPGTLVIDAEVCAFESTTPAGAGYAIFGTVRTTGAAATLVGTPDKIVNEEATLAACNADIVVSGNTAIIRVTGTAGLTINWRVLATYTYVS